MRESLDDDPQIAETCRGITKFTQRTNVPVLSDDLISFNSCLNSNFYAG
jgi:hypothetical protein